MMQRAASVVIGLALCATACDTTGDDAGAQRTQPPDSASPTVASDAASDERSSEASDETVGASCADVEQRTLETAVEAFFAVHQRFPTDPNELYEEGYLRVAYAGFEIGVDGTVVRDASRPCADAGSVDDQGRPTTVDAWLTWFGDDFVDAVGGTACATEAAALVNAAAEFERANAGFAAQTFADIEPYLDRPIVLWVVDDPGDAPVPAADSGCSAAGFDESIDVDVPDDRLVAECLAQQRTFETALQAWLAEHPDATDPPTEAELAEDDLRGESVYWDLDGWELVPAPASPCDPGAPCGVVLRTVETAVEAFYAENGVWPASIDDLVGTYLRADEEIELVELGDDGRVEPAPGSVCSVG